ncbi:MAG: DUF420 domain-containing protein [Candidatus Omnitrophica bacterium]|nr:DUF420 domain-containing protein [Candidatus Omnitrophota bacterium]
MTVRDLPALNAILNGISAVFLILGYIGIKQGRQAFHTKMMVAAFVTSLLFLTSYLYYHFNVHLVTRYQGQGLLRPIYFFILFTHIPLAALVAPASISAIVLAVRGRLEWHKRITRWLWPVWMYVSVTGVLIYVMLYVI